VPGLLVVSHGKLAGELVDAVRRIVADVDALEAVSIGWEVDMEQASRRIQEAIARVDRKGRRARPHRHVRGTPSNLALSLLEPGRIEGGHRREPPHVDQVRQPAGDAELSEVARRVAEQGRQSIQVASELLEGPPRQSGPEDAP
jgi:PTS system mannose-specific IIA component